MSTGPKWGELYSESVKMIKLIDLLNATVEDAFVCLLKNNTWIEENGFHVNAGQIIARELANDNRIYL